MGEDPFLHCWPRVAHLNSIHNTHLQCDLKMKQCSKLKIGACGSNGGDCTHCIAFLIRFINISSSIPCEAISCTLKSLTKWDFS